MPRDDRTATEEDATTGDGTTGDGTTEVEAPTDEDATTEGATTGDGTTGEGARLPDFDVEEVAAFDGPADESATLRDDDLHRPDELDGETVACTLTETEAEKRAAWIRSEMVPHLEAVRRLEDDAGSEDDTRGDDRAGGYTLVFAEEALEAVMRFARHEHWCCSFAHFEVHVTPGEEPNELSVYGPEGTDEMFGAEFVDRMAEAAGVPGPG